MGYVRAEIQIANPKKGELKPIVVNSLVDTSALMLCIPEQIAMQLELDELEKRQVTTADGRNHLVPYVGPVLLSFENRKCFVGALVLGDEVLLGAVPLEDMDLIVIPSQRALRVNPSSPNIAHAMVK
jgi:clan AA aspartic protease